MSKSEAAASVEIEETYKEELRRSFELIKPISVEAAAIFYPTLWELNPATKASSKKSKLQQSRSRSDVFCHSSPRSYVSVSYEHDGY